MDGWMDGWVGGRARLRIAYSNQKSPEGIKLKNIGFLSHVIKTRCAVIVSFKSH